MISWWCRKMGSSPHTRGAQVPEPLLQCGARIIPAYAGSTCGGLIDARTQQDHPRIRGEHPWTSFAPSPYAGSSPHTRGALAFGDHVGVGPGIIPAYAGSTARRRYPAVPPTDHPRIRGEHYSHECELPDRHGSSPHTRGAPMISMCGAGTRGIIPAYAGSTEGALGSGW